MEGVVWFQFSSVKEVELVLQKVTTSADPFPFVSFDRWMQFTCDPQRQLWVKILGVPMWAWNEEVFKLLGNCNGNSLEVDRRTTNKETFVAGCRKVMLNRSLLAMVGLWVEDLRYAIHIAEDSPAFAQGRENDQVEVGDSLARVPSPERRC